MQAFMETVYRPVSTKAERDPFKFTKTDAEVKAHFALVDEISRRQVDERKREHIRATTKDDAE
jgi:hypothetical protein